MKNRILHVSGTFHCFKAQMFRKVKSAVTLSNGRTRRASCSADALILWTTLRTCASAVILPRARKMGLRTGGATLSCKDFACACDGKQTVHNAPLRILCLPRSTPSGVPGQPCLLL